MKFTQEEKQKLSSKITKWYRDCFEDYGITGRYIDCLYDERKDEGIIFEEGGELLYVLIEVLSAYDIDTIYAIWSSPECTWHHFVK